MSSHPFSRKFHGHRYLCFDFSAAAASFRRICRIPWSQEASPSTSIPSRRVVWIVGLGVSTPRSCRG